MVKLKQLAVGLVSTAILSVGATAHAALQPVYSQDFSGVNGATTAATLGLVDLNRSTLPADSWGPGSTNVFNAQSGAITSYFANAFTASGAASGPISDWLIFPVLSLANGYTFTFYARGFYDAVLAAGFTDSLQVRYCTGATCTALTNASLTTDTALVTLFGGLSSLLTINPTFSTTDPLESNAWVQYTATITGLPAAANGRFAVRYVVDDVATHGNYVGIDSVVISAVPEPESMLLMGLGLSAMAFGLRRKARK